jgi:hypothetical protein
MKTIASACAALFLFAVIAPAAAQEPPVPRMLRGMPKEKGQWRMDILEGGRGAPASMTICTDNLIKSSGEPRAPRGEPRCKGRLVKDTAEEAVMEMTCPDRNMTLSMKRESAKSVLMQMHSSGGRGPQNMKMRYTHLGACREGQSGISYDKNSEQCKAMQARAAQMDPEKSCAGAGAQREQCVQRMRESLKQMLGMCG